MRQGLTRVMSFGFSHGVPEQADLVLDVRFLDNPYWVEELRERDGTDADVQRFVLAQADATEFLERTTGILGRCLPRFEREGKSDLMVAVGCTGGRHRSVVMAERLYRSLVAAEAGPVELVHRDLPPPEAAP